MNTVYLTVKQLVKCRPWTTEGGIRWWIFNEDQNDFHKCVLRVGRKVLISLPKFDEWVESHHQDGGVS